MSKKFLFYFIHPAKFHSFRFVINKLKEKGHQVDIVIISKDILEELVKSEGWEYTNIFPEGRRIKYLHTYLSAAVNLFKTLYRLLKFIKGKTYDLIVTDDLITFVGRIKRQPVIFFTDDDLRAVPESFILMATAKYILCPEVAYMGLFSYKKIGYYGLKSLAHLHPNIFVPDLSKLANENEIIPKKYFLIRCVSATSTHDVGKKGLTDDILIEIVRFLEKYGKIIINTQRELPKDIQKYVLQINKMDISHYLSFAKIFISDSTTMCAEAAVLGTPSVEIDDWFSDFEQYKLLSEKYGLLKGFTSKQKNEIIKHLENLITNKELENDFNKRRLEFIDDHIDLSSFMLWLFENYQNSVKEYFKNKNVQLRFKV